MILVILAEENVFVLLKLNFKSLLLLFERTLYAVIKARGFLLGIMKRVRISAIFGKNSHEPSSKELFYLNLKLHLVP